MTKDEVFWSCPTETKVFEELYKLEVKQKDEDAWIAGVYVARAIASCFNKDSQYPDRPLTEENGFGLDKEQKKQRDINAFVAQMQTMSSNWQAIHGNKGSTE